MTDRDLVGLVASFGYAGGLVLGAELLHRRAGVPQWLTRKLVHIGAGMWVWGALALFDTWQIGLIPYAAFIVLNYLFYRYRIFRALDDAGGSLGTVYFALVITALFGLLWRTDGSPDRSYAAAAGVMALTWGDALAALVGQRYGRRHYQVGASRRTWEGSAVMLLGSFVAIALTLLLLPGSPLSPASAPLGLGRALLAAGLGAAAATLVEAVSPHGTDNLGIPVVVAAVALLLGA